MNIPKYSLPGKQRHDRGPEGGELTGGYIPPERGDMFGRALSPLTEHGRRSAWLPLVTAILALFLSFGIGFLAGRDAGLAVSPADRLWIEQLPPEVRGATSSLQGAGTTAEATPNPTQTRSAPPEQPAAVGAVLPATSGAFVASRSGTKYYFPWCATAQRIKEENRVWFATREEARAAGYEPASNCKGLQ